MNLYTSKTEAAAKRAFEAAERGEYETVVHLIDHSFNTEDCDENGNSLLHYAVKGKNQKLVEYLVERCNMDPHGQISPCVRLMIWRQGRLWKSILKVNAVFPWRNLTAILF